MGECRENALVELIYREELTPSRRFATAEDVLLSFTVVGTGSDTLTLSERNDPGLLVLDNVSLNPSAVATVPEPTSLALFGLPTLTGAVYYGWRRRKQPA